MGSGAQNLVQPENLDQQIYKLFKDKFAALEPPGSGWDGLKNRLLAAALSQPKLLPREIGCDLSDDNSFT
jgi:hypothetical protein